MADDKTLDRVRKLFDLAAHPDTPEHEAERANERAQELMARHAIDQAMLEDAKVTSNDVTTLDIKVDAPYANEKKNLLHIIARNSACDTVFQAPFRRNKSGKKDKDGNPKGRFLFGKGCTVTVWGFPSDLERVEFLFTHLMVQLAGEIRRGTPMLDEDTGTYRASVIEGFTGSVHLRMSRLRRQAEADTEQGSSGRGAELVLADRRSLVQRAKDEENPDLIHHETAPSSGSGWRYGFEAGQRADLGQTRVQKQRRALAS